MSTQLANRMRHGQPPPSNIHPGQVDCNSDAAPYGCTLPSVKALQQDYKLKRFKTILPPAPPTVSLLLKRPSPAQPAVPDNLRPLPPHSASSLLERVMQIIIQLQSQTPQHSAFPFRRCLSFFKSIYDVIRGVKSFTMETGTTTELGDSRTVPSSRTYVRQEFILSTNYQMSSKLPQCRRFKDLKSHLYLLH